MTQALERLQTALIAPLIFSPSRCKLAMPPYDDGDQGGRRIAMPNPSPDLGRMWSTRDPAEVKQLQESFDRFYSENEKVLKEAVAMDILNANTSKKLQRFEAATAMFLEQSKVVLEGLKFLGELHPVLKVAINAFSGIVSLEILRRDIDLKALSVKIQMQNMMCALFESRKLRMGGESLTLGRDLAQLMNEVAIEITECGSALNCYLERHFISRIARAPEFEKRLADYISHFENHRATLQHLIASYTAGVVQKTHGAVTRLEYKVDNLVTILHQLESSREKEATKFIESNGGIARCIADKKLLADLMSKAGDYTVDLMMSSASDEQSRTRMMEVVRQALQRELMEDFEVMLKKNLANFETILQIQSNNLDFVVHQVHNQTSLMMKISNEMASVFPGKRAHILITDPVLKNVWEKMELRRSVRAKKFVLTFKDYHSQLYPSKTVLAAQDSSAFEVPPSRTLESETMADSSMLSITVGPGGDSGLVEDEWALHYIDVAHLDTIVEAIDADYSGFISIHEANMFAVGRPKGWSLLLWFAFWAAGWAQSVRKYKDKILSTFRQIFDARLNVLPCNRTCVGDYFEGQACRSLDCLLRSAQPPHTDEHDVKLDRLVSDYDEQLETRLRSNLEGLQYNLSSVEKVALATGPGRIERFVLPLLHLLLQHHLRIVKLASHRRLAYLDMWSAQVSILSVFSSMEERAKRLEAIFRQKSRSVQDQFKKFSFGMLELFTVQLDYQYIDNNLLGSPTQDLTKDSSNDTDSASSPIVGDHPELMRKLLEGDPGPILLSEHPVSTFNTSRPAPQLNSESGPLSGAWTGRLFLADPTAPVYAMAIEFEQLAESDDVVTGTIDFYCGTVILSGVLRCTNLAQSEGGRSKSRTPDPEFSAFCEDPNKERLSQQVDEAAQGKEADLLESFGLEQKDNNPLVLGIETNELPGYGFGYCFRLSPANASDGKGSRHWKGEWCYTHPNEWSTFYPCEIFRRPPESLRFLPMIEAARAGNASGAEDGASTQLPIDDEHASRSGETARARWAFAIEVVRYQIRQRIYSPSFHIEITKERKAFVHLMLKRLTRVLDDDGDAKELTRLQSEINPTVASVWTSIANYYHVKEVATGQASRTICDYCKRENCFHRHFCITCVLDSMNDQIDICKRCLAKNEPLTIHAFSHKPSHTLCKTRNRRIIKVERATIVMEARKKAQRVKELFREDDELADRPSSELAIGTVSQNNSETSHPECFHCGSVVELPCWVCTVCNEDTFVCRECEANDVHDETHPILRIVDCNDEDNTSDNEKDIFIQKTKQTIEDGMQALEGRIMGSLSEKMDGLEEKFVGGLSALEDRLAGRMDQVEARVGDIDQAISSFHPVPSSAIAAHSAIVPGRGQTREANHPEASEMAALARRMDNLEAMMARILEAVESRRDPGYP